MATYDPSVGGPYRGPQQAAQGAQPYTVNNGNPNSIYNQGRDASPASRQVPQTPMLPNWARRNDTVDYLGQNPNLGRYVAPQVDQNGNPVARDQGPYASNLPNSYGQPFGYASPNIGSVFGPQSGLGALSRSQPSRSGGGMGSFIDMLRSQLNRSQPDPEYDFQPNALGPSQPINYGNARAKPMPAPDNKVQRQSFTPQFLFDPRQYSSIGQ